MEKELTRKRFTVPDGTRTLAAKAPWHRIALAVILILSAFLNFYGLAGAGYANDYYSAGVKNMLTSWSNFFFASFDAGFISIDKPPLGFWIQAASAWLLGFHGWAMILPQAVAGVLSVALLYHLVRRPFGPVAGLVAALVLALTPVIVATSRNNTIDMLLVLTVLAGAWAVVRAAETGRLRWLLLCAVIVGLGFNIKMMQAFLVLPAFYLLYLVAAPANWWRRIVHLGLATVVLLVVSLSWAAVVDLTPSTDRPYVGSSQHNSALELASGYNGLSRLVGRGNELINPQGGFNVGSDTESAQGPGGPGGPGGGGPGGVGENGEKGPFRLLDQQLGGQIGWLLPLAAVGLLAASWREGRPRLPLNRRQGALVLWGMWLLTMYGFFSVAGMFHRYYLVMTAPAIAALVGIGMVALWKDYRSPGWRGWLLPLTLVGVAGVQDYILWAYEGWAFWLAPGISGLCLVAAGVLAVARLRRWQKTQTSSKLLIGAAAVGLLALLVAPAAWASYNVLQGGGGGGPMVGAGPRPAESGGGPGGPPGPPPGGGGPRGPGGPGGPPGGNADPALVEYLQANKDDAEYLVATTDSHRASSLILNTDEKVIDMKGFEGHDPVFTADEIAGLADGGAVRFFLIGGGPGGPPPGDPPPGGPQGGPPPGGPPPGMGSDEATTWVQDNCQQVPQEEWQSSEAGGPGGGGPPGRGQSLYDCGATGGS